MAGYHVIYCVKYVREEVWMSEQKYFDKYKGRRIESKDLRSMRMFLEGR